MAVADAQQVENVVLPEIGSWNAHASGHPLEVVVFSAGTKWLDPEAIETVITMQDRGNGFWGGAVVPVGSLIGVRVTDSNGTQTLAPYTKLQTIDGVGTPSVARRTPVVVNRHENILVGPTSVLTYLHPFTASPEGTFQGATRVIADLKARGTTHIVVSSPWNTQTRGRPTSGYETTDLYNTFDPYGSLDDLRGLIDACHHRGVGVILDNVYNHFGPRGLYLPILGPTLARTGVSWGVAPDFYDDGRYTMQDYVRDHVRFSMELGADGLRLDSAHNIQHGRMTVAQMVAYETHRLGARSGGASVILEVDHPNPSYLNPTGAYSNMLGADYLYGDFVLYGLHRLLRPEVQLGHFAGMDEDTLMRMLNEGGLAVPFDRPLIGPHHDMCNLDPYGLRLNWDNDTVRMALNRILAATPGPRIFLGGDDFGSQSKHPWVTAVEGESGDYYESVIRGRVAAVAGARGVDVGEIADPTNPAALEKVDWALARTDPHHAAWAREFAGLMIDRGRYGFGRDIDRIERGQQGEVLITSGAVTVVVNTAESPVEVNPDWFAGNGPVARGGRFHLGQQEARLVTGAHFGRSLGDGGLVPAGARPQH